MEKTRISEIINKQRNYFYSGATLSLKKRQYALVRLREVIALYEKEIAEALREDLGKSEFEGYMCEIGMAKSELTYMLKHLPGYVKEKRVRTPLAQFPARSFQKPSPHGVTLIMSPWNYPFLLTIEPLIDALAAGNTAVVKPSAYSPKTSEIIEKMLSEAFPEKYVAVVTGGREENSFLLEQHFDYIFFTGSQNVGKEVMRKAAEYLTPVTLELGGKSPCIVEESANIKLAAKRIVFGKFLNCGQTCVAPDYIFCDEKVKDELVQALIKEVKRQFGKVPQENKNYGKIISEKHYQRVESLIDPSKVVCGGEKRPEELRIEPTIMDCVTFEDAVMQEEIFGPILPIVTYPSLETAVARINQMQHPLALYLFTENKAAVEMVKERCGFGGGCINDTIIHLATCDMGFGGFGESGMGSYHGKAGFDTFSHYKSMVDKKTWLDLPMRYQPYRRLNRKLVNLFLR